MVKVLTIPQQEYVDLRQLDRSILRHPRSIHRDGDFVAGADLSHRLVDMCQQAGMRRVELGTFLNFQVHRRVKGRWKKARITSSMVYGMYERLRHGEVPALFLTIIASVGYRPAPPRSSTAPQLKLELVSTKPTVP